MKTANVISNQHAQTLLRPVAMSRSIRELRFLPTDFELYRASPLVLLNIWPYSHNKGCENSRTETFPIRDFQVRWVGESKTFLAGWP